MGDYSLEGVYQGGYSTMDPEKSDFFTGYKLPAGSMSLSTDIRTADQLSSVSERIKTGLKHVELGTFQPQIFESIPDQHLKEINRMAKLTGVDVSIHGIMVDPSGIGQQGYNDLVREGTERQMLSNVMRAHQLNPEGNIPVTFHSSAGGWPGAEFRPLEENGKKTFEKWKIPLINQETGQIQQVVETDQRYVPGMTAKELKSGGKKWTAEERVANLNETQWDDNINQIFVRKDAADRKLKESAPLAEPLFQMIHEGKVDPNYLKPDQLSAIHEYQDAGHDIEDSYLHVRTLFERAYKYGSEENKRKLEEVSESFRDKYGVNFEKLKGGLSEQSGAVRELMEELRPFAPELFKPLEDFAVDKSAQTFGNIAFKAYKKFGNTAPVISIENPPAGEGLSRAEDLKKLVEESRKKFVQNATADGMSEGEARKQADKLIGVTWDVGHINMIRKFGYEEKDTIKEAEKIAPFVKHIHLSDNFGYDHTELPMGMGNVPIKEIMGRLGEKGFEAQKVIEAGNWWQHFKTPPVKESFEAFGSPIYSMKMSPQWSQAIGTQGYFGGYGSMLPQVNYETMGAGFSGLPSELGGQRAGGRGSRMSGTPME